MNLRILKQVLDNMGAPATPDVVHAYNSLYKVQQEQEQLKHVDSKEEIYALIERERKEIKRLEEENALYSKKIHSISEINGMLIIRPQKSQFGVFQYQNRKFQQLKKEMTELTNNMHNKLAQKPKIPKKPTSRKELTEEMKENIQHFIRSQALMQDKKHEFSVFNQTEDVKLYSLFDEVKDLYYVCVNQGLEVTKFDNAETMSKILGIEN